MLVSLLLLLLLGAEDVIEVGVYRAIRLGLLWSGGVLRGFSETCL